MTSEPLTMSVHEYSELTGIGEDTVRSEVALGRIPHRRVGKRGKIRILTIPALAQLGVQTHSGNDDNSSRD